VKAKKSSEMQIAILKISMESLAWLTEYPIEDNKPKPLLKWFADQKLSHLAAYYDVLEHERFEQQPIPIGVSLN